MTSSLFSGGDVSGIESQLAGLVPQFSALSSEAAALSPQFTSEGTDIYNTAIDQYKAGAAGQVTPNQQAAIDQTLKQMDLSTEGTYANLGLGGSTMATQDVNANKQKSLAQSAEFSALDEELGLKGLSSALGFQSEGVNALGTAGNILGGATQALSGAGNLAANQQAQQLSALNSLGTSLGGKSGGAGAGASAALF